MTRKVQAREIQAVLLRAYLCAKERGGKITTLFLWKASLFRASCRASQRTVALVAAADCVSSHSVSGVSCINWSVIASTVVGHFTQIRRD